MSDGRLSEVAGAIAAWERERDLSGGCLVTRGGVTADRATGTPEAFNASNSIRRQSRAHRTPQIEHRRDRLHDWPRQPRVHRTRGSGNPGTGPLAIGVAG